MKDYEIIELEKIVPVKTGKNIESRKIKENWIYLTGTITSRGEQKKVQKSLPSKIDTVFDYDIKTFKLEYENPNEEYAYETYGYNVFIVGKLIGEDKIKVRLMMDSPDITGRGVVCLNRTVQIAQRVVQVPFPFIYLPMDKVKLPSDISRMYSPCFEVPYDSNALYCISLNAESQQTDGTKTEQIPTIEIFLPNANGYVSESPAFYVGLDKNAVLVRRNNTKITFKGKHVCSR